jgi:hypothetical protein
MSYYCLALTEPPRSQKPVQVQAEGSARREVEVKKGAVPSGRPLFVQGVSEAGKCCRDRNFAAVPDATVSADVATHAAGPHFLILHGCLRQPMARGQRWVLDRQAWISFVRRSWRPGAPAVVRSERSSIPEAVPNSDRTPLGRGRQRITIWR